MFSLNMDFTRPLSPPFDPTDLGSDIGLRRNKIPKLSKAQKEHHNRVREIDAMVVEDNVARSLVEGDLLRERIAMAKEDEPWLLRQIE
jgi:stalled ribosome alternative rescue factor ArfA